MAQKLLILSSDNSLINLRIEETVENDSADNSEPRNSENYYKALITGAEIDEMVLSELEAEIDDIISDALFEYVPPIKGHYCLSELDIYEKTEKTIRAKYDKVIVGALINSTKIYEKRASDYIVPVLLDRMTDEAEECDKGNAISKGLFAFVDRGEWQISWTHEIGDYSEENKPIIWFGIKGDTPKDGWILDYQNPSWSEFWFPEDARSEWCSIVEDCNETLLVWMTAECDVDLPDPEEVLKRCPIDINENDGPQRLEKKITSYVNQISRK